MQCGNGIILLPYTKWDGVIGSRSSQSDDTYVRGRSLRSPSTSTTIVWRLSSVACVLPNIFLSVDFVRPMSLSQNPPNHGARFGMNFHSVPLRERDSDKSVDENKYLSSSAAAKYVDALSDSRSLGNDLRPANLQNACKKLSTVRSVTISK